jgi:hypothetical protein
MASIVRLCVVAHPSPASARRSRPAHLTHHRGRSGPPATELCRRRAASPTLCEIAHTKNPALVLVVARVALDALMFAVVRRPSSRSPHPEHKPEGRDRQAPSRGPWCAVRGEGVATDKFVMRFARQRVLLSGLRAVVLPRSSAARGPDVVHLRPEWHRGTASAPSPPT